MTESGKQKYLPDAYKRFGKQFPDVAKSFSQLADGIHAAGPLDERSRRLVKLGIAIGLESPGAVRSQIRQAQAAGINLEEVQHAIVLALTSIGLPKTIAAITWMQEATGQQPG